MALQSYCLARSKLFCHGSNWWQLELSKKENLWCKNLGNKGWAYFWTRPAQMPFLSMVKSLRKNYQDSLKITMFIGLCTTQNCLYRSATKWNLWIITSTMWKNNFQFSFKSVIRVYKRIWAVVCTKSWEKDKIGLSHCSNNQGWQCFIVTFNL